MPPNSSDKSLIVEFPAAALPDPKRTAVLKSVRFSSNVDGVFIPYPTDEENKRRWYSEQHQKLFKKKITRDAIQCSAVLDKSITSGPMDMHQSKDFAFSVIGLEHLISHDVFERWESIKAMRKHHVEIVVQAQERLRRCHKFTCPEKLACVAEVNSAKNRMKATARAQLAAPITYEIPGP